MRILIVGSAAPAALERIYEKRFTEAGAEAFLFNARSPVGNIHRLPGRIVTRLRRFLPQAGLLPINNQLLQTVSEVKPDVVWVFKGMEILPETLEKIRTMGPLLANYNPDHPFQFTGPGSGNKLMTRSLGIYDAHLTYHSVVAAMLTERFQAPVAMLPFGFDLEASDYEALTGTEECLRACFLGSADPERAAFVQEMRQNGVPVDVFGGGWDKWSVSPNLGQVHGPVYGLEFWRVLRQYRVQLNIFRPHNIGSHNMRSFDIPGVGGIMLAPESREHSQFFEADKEAVFFSSMSEAVEKAKEILAWDHHLAQKMRDSARNKSIEAKYHYADRAIEAIAFFEQKLTEV